METTQKFKWDDFDNGIPAIDKPLVFWFEGRWIEVDLGQQNYDNYRGMLLNLARHGHKPKKPPTTRHHNRSYTKPQPRGETTITVSKGPVRITGGPGGMGKPATSKSASVTAKPRAGRSATPKLAARRNRPSETSAKERRRAITSFADQVMGIKLKPSGRIPKDVLDRYEASLHTNGSKPPVPSTPATTGVK